MIFQIVLAVYFCLMGYLWCRWYFENLALMESQMKVIKAYRAENEALRASLRFHTACTNMYAQRELGNEPLAQKWLEESQRIFNETFSE